MIDPQGGYNQLWKNLMAETRGKRKGQLWRSEREWIATDGIYAGRTEKAITTTLKSKQKKHQQIMKAFDDKGWSKGRNTRCKGFIPMEFMLAQPELWHDDAAVDAFFKEFPLFSTNHNVVTK